MTTAAINEWIGIIYYRVRGWAEELRRGERIRRRRNGAALRLRLVATSQVLAGAGLASAFIQYVEGG